MQGTSMGIGSELTDMSNHPSLLSIFIELFGVRR